MMPARVGEHVSGRDPMLTHVERMTAMPAPCRAQIAKKFVQKMRCFAVCSRVCWHVDIMAQPGKFPNS